MNIHPSYRPALHGIAFVLFCLLGSCTWNTPKRTGPHEGYSTEENYEIRREIENRKVTAKHTIRYVEFDEAGDYWDESQLIETERQLRSSSDTIHVMYVHGWKNGSVTEDAHQFNYFLSRLSGALDGRKSKHKVRATMLCWRGDTWHPLSKVPPNAPDVASRFAEERMGCTSDDGPFWRLYPKNTNYLSYVGLAIPRQLGYVNRHRAAIRMAGGSMLDAINRLGDASRASGSNKTILIGHSMGALIVEKSLLHSLSSKSKSLPADLVFLMNSAAPAQYAKNTIEVLGRTDGLRSPSIVSLTSETDYATGSLQPLGGATFEGVYTRALLGDYRSDSGLTGVSQTTLAANTPGHVRELHSHEVQNLGRSSKDFLIREFLGDYGPWLFSWNLKPTGERSDKTRMVAHAMRSTDSKPGVLRFLGADGTNGSVFELSPKAPSGFNSGSAYWILQVPKEISDGHGDIWNPNVANLMVAVARKRQLPK